MCQSPEYQILCPYCNFEFSIPLPPGLGLPHDLESVPYARDIGRFDPRDRSEWFDPRGWSRIGEDFFPIIGWEHIGILRLTHPELHVMYRVQVCPHCMHPFDLYANYTDAAPLGQLWPHLFAKDPHNPSEILEYYGESFPIWIVRSFGRLVGSNSWGAVLLGLFLFLLPMVPKFSQLALSWASSATAALAVPLGTRAIATAGVIGILILAERYVRYLETTREFGELLKISKQRGMTYWRNYLLCRFVGVQQQGAAPQVTQMDLFAGGLAAAVLFATWTAAKLKGQGLAAGLDIALAIALLFLSYIFAKSILKPPYSRKCLVGIVIIIAAFIGGLYWLGTRLGTNTLAACWSAVDSSLDFLFWVATAYAFGAATWIAMSSTVYVLRGLSKIPMRLNPYDGFSHLQPLRTLQLFSSGLMLTLFLSVIGIVSFLIALSQPSVSGAMHQAAHSSAWLLTWLRWGLALTLAVLCISTKESTPIALTTLYAFFAGLLSNLRANLGGFVVVSGPTLALGAFFSLLMMYQVLTTDAVIKQLVEKARSQALQEAANQIRRLQEEAASLAEQTAEILEDTQATDLAVRRKLALESLVALIQIRNYLETVSAAPKLWKRLAQLGGPLLSSLILPALAEFIASSL